MNTVTILQGHVLDRIRDIPDNSVHCVVTSVPYWGLRDYGVEPQVWGGESDCDHIWGEEVKTGEGYSAGSRKRWQHNQSREDNPENWQKETKQGSFCQLCGAWRGSYGLEPTIELYVAHTVEIFREVRRVLRKDGCLFLNIGDSYMANTGRQNPSTKQHKGTGFCGPNRTNQPGLKAKDLCGVPWRVALAIQADGWWLRSDIIWAKPNPMPESCKDRPTRSHEYIFLLTKSSKYFWDQEAVKEIAIEGTDLGLLRGKNAGGPGADKIAWHAQSIKNRQAAGIDSRTANPSGTRNLRSVWNIATAPFPEAHFATFPPSLVEKCVKAGCPENGTVLDPFMGSGTTCMVAGKLRRDSIGIELNPDYVNMAKKRVRKELGFLVEVVG